MKLSKTGLASAILAWTIIQVVPLAYVLWSMWHESEIGVGVVAAVYILGMGIAPLAAYLWDPLRAEREIIDRATARWRTVIGGVAIVLVACVSLNEYAMWREARIFEVCTSYAADLSPIFNGAGFEERSFNQCVMSMDGSGRYFR